METRIKSIQYTQGRYSIINLFGHTSRGLPGLEIIGQGPNMAMLRSMREKFIYISKELGLKIPPLKYVICIDNSWDHSVVKNMTKSGYPYLELPVLILFWSMAGLIPIKELHDCYAQGCIDLDKKIALPPLTIENFPDFLIKKFPLKILGVEKIYPGLKERINIIPLDEIFGKIAHFVYEEQVEI